jgi:hypothetical protein
VSATVTARPVPSGLLNPAARPRQLLVVSAVVIGVLATLIRLALHTSAFDVFGDEVIYADIGRSTVSGGFPRFFGEPFFLHGPGFFYLEAGWAHLFGEPSGLIPWIYELRTLNALLAGGSAVVLVLLAARAASVRAGVVAGLLFAADPFCLRQNDRVLLETAMMFWVLVGYLVFSTLIIRPPKRGSWARAAASGLLFGCAVLTKDEAALLTVLPMLFLAVAGWGPRRWLILVTAGAAAVPYACYVGVVAANGYLPGWWSAKTSGLGRLLGIVQTTGFHSSAHGSLAGRLVAEGGYFITTYLILAVAVPALWILLRRGSPVARVLGTLHCAALVTLGYAVTLGTLEEQELYLLVVPSILTLAVAIDWFLGTGPGRQSTGARSMNRLRLPTVFAAAAAVLALNLVTAGQWLSQPDDGFARLLPYMASHVPAGTAVTIAAASRPVNQTDGGRYALEGRYDVGLWWTPKSIRRERVRYVLAEWGPIDEGYSYLSPSRVHRLVRGAKLVFYFAGRTYGHLALYELPP